MKVKRQKRKILFKGLGLTLALGLSVLCTPIDGLALAAIEDQTTDYNYLTVGTSSEKVDTVIKRGQTYNIPKAYIGGKSTLVVGDESIEGTKVTHSNGSGEYMTIDSSEVTVRYGSASAATTEKIGDFDEDGNIDFVADKEGTYVITYSYTYTDVLGDTYTNSYDLKVQSELSSASINFNNNQEKFIPSILDLSMVEGEANVYIPTPEIKDEEGNVIENVEVVSKLPTTVDESKDYLVVSATGGTNISSLTLGGDSTTGFFIKDADLRAADGAGSYTIKFSFYMGDEFVTSATKTMQVKAKFDNEAERYYKNYKLVLDLASDFPTSGETGVEISLPAAIGKTSTESTPASESVDVFYKVKVKYMAKSEDKAYTDLDKTVYGDVIDANGYLVDPTSFTPLQDGYYTFNYEIVDFYGKTASTGDGVYALKNLTDKQNPVSIVYDAADEKLDEDGNIVDESHKLASNVNANSVVVYAIGMKDNISKTGTLVRKIVDTSTEERLVIDHYDEYNLVFNYRKTSVDAYTNLLTNNYLIEKAAKAANKTIASDADMLAYLKSTKTLIVIDNGNIGHIYDLFKDANVFGQTFSDSAALKTWLQEKYETEEGRGEIAGLGFAYIPSDETFGQTTAEASTGMGAGTYYVHYVATDAAGNKSTTNSKKMYVGTYTDSEAPTINFSTTLADAYLPTATVKFDAPTVKTSDSDGRLLFRVAYRYRDGAGNVLSHIGEDGQAIASSELLDLTELYTDISAKNIMVDGSDPTVKYADWHTAGGNDGYLEITDSSASSYSIKLKDAPADAEELQIITFTYDDAGNANVYGETVKIMRSKDNEAPKFENANIAVLDEDILQGATVKLPEITVSDDAVSYVSYEISVKHIDGTTIEDIDVAGSTGRAKVTSLDGRGTYVVKGGTFVASFGGKYQACITVKDSNGNSVSYFANYTVVERDIYWQEPKMSVSMENQTVELDDKVEIEVSTPTISYNIPKSVTYSEYAKSEQPTVDFADINYVVIGVDQDGKATDMGWYIEGSEGVKKGSFVAEKVQKYEIKYHSEIVVYNHNTFVYDEVTGSFTLVDGSTTAKFYAVDKNEIKVVDGANVYNVKRVVTKEDDGTTTESVEITKNGQAATATMFNDTDTVLSWIADLKQYNDTSDTYRIEVKDTKGPSLKAYNYKEEGISSAELAANKSIDIYGIQATDASGINLNESKITVSWRPVGKAGENKTPEYKGQTQDFKFTDFGEVTDGKITVTYYVVDNNGNSTSKTYTIAVGDNEGPALTFDDDFLADSYEIGEVKVDLTKIYATDANMADGAEPVITLKDANGEEPTLKYETTDLMVYDLQNVGTYTLTVEMTDKIGNKTTKTFSIEVTAKAQDAVMTYQVVGTILIVVSVLVLAGVVIYFIVSKVKLDKELKK